jgi:hypothetical protein
METWILPRWHATSITGLMLTTEALTPTRWAAQALQENILHGRLQFKRLFFLG